MNTNVSTGRIEATRLTSSPQGNPRYRVYVTCANGDVLIGDTRPNSDAMQGAPHSGLVDVMWHQTPKGRVVIDCVRRAEVTA